jgi:hypothetical protein
MAIVQNPITGRSRNKFANGIFSTWNGLNVVRSKPLTVANPKTAKQTAQRVHTSTNAQFAKAAGALMEIGFRVRAIGQSARSAGLKANYPAISVNPATGLPQITYADLVVSKGSISPAVIDDVDPTAGTRVVDVTYPTAIADPSQSSTDKVGVLVVNENTGESATSVGVATRADGAVGLLLPSNLVAGNKLHTYLFFYSQSSNAVSDTSYLFETV